MNHDTRKAGSGGDPQGSPGSDYQLRELEARFARRMTVLESQVTRARGAAWAAGIGFVMALTALGLTLKEVVLSDDTQTLRHLVAEGITLVDGEGVERGRLTTDPDGQAALSLSDHDGRERIRLTVLGDGSPGLTMHDPESKPRAVLGYLPDGTTNLVFTDRLGAIRTLMGVGPDGSPSMTVFDDGSAAEAAEGADDS